jgi:hypothetical protein
MEKVLEKSLANHGIELSDPHTGYLKDEVYIFRTIGMMLKNSIKEINYEKRFKPNEMFVESIRYDLEWQAVAGIVARGPIKLAYCNLYHKHKDLLNFLQSQNNLTVSKTGKLKNLSIYEIRGNVKKVIDILTNYWVKKFYKKNC